MYAPGLSAPRTTVLKTLYREHAVLPAPRLTPATPVQRFHMRARGGSVLAEVAAGSAAGPGSVSGSVRTAATATGSSSLQGQQVDDFAADTRPVILYDGVCNLCNNAVNFMLDWDPKGTFRLAALQSPAGKRLLARSGRAVDDISSIVLVEKDRHYIKSEAILRISYGMSNPFPFLALFGFPVPLLIRDPVYDMVANNRYNFFGKREVCRVSDDGFRERFIAN